MLILQQLGRFGLVGLVNTAIGLTVIYGLMFFCKWPSLLANFVGFAVGVGIGFFLNGRWSFSYQNLAAHNFYRYAFVVIISYLLNFSIVYTAEAYLAVNAYFAQIIGMAVYSLLFFFGCRIYVFK